MCRVLRSSHGTPESNGARALKHSALYPLPNGVGALYVHPPYVVRVYVHSFANDMCTDYAKKEERANADTPKRSRAKERNMLCIVCSSA